MILSTYTDPALMKRVYRLEFDEAELIRLPFTPELWRQLQYSFDQGSVSGALFGLFLMASEWEKLMKVASTCPVHQTLTRKISFKQM